VKIAVLTSDEPLHLPAFFARFLARRADDVAAVFPCPARAPGGRRRGPWGQFRRYVRTFGWLNGLRLAWRVAGAKVRGRLGMGARTGRGGSVPAVARHYGVVCETCEDVNAPAFLQRLRGDGVDVVLSVSCPQIFKEDLIALPEKGCLNIHGADLPRYRGLLPSFWMLLHNEPEAAVSVFEVDAGIDTGLILGKRRFPIRPDDTLHTFLVRAKREACDLVLQVLDAIEAGTAEAHPPEGEGSYFGWPTRQDYRRFRRAGRRLW